MRMPQLKNFTLNATQTHTNQIINNLNSVKSSGKNHCFSLVQIQTFGTLAYLVYLVEELFSMGSLGSEYNIYLHLRGIEKGWRKTSNTETSRNNIDFLSEYTIELLKCILV